jgi:GT2 family glycosyltransferase
VLLLNNDVVVAQDMVARLVNTMEANDRIAMLTPRVFYYDRPTEVYWDGGTIDWEASATPHDSRGLPVDNGIVRSGWLDGCAVLIRVAAVRDFGLLDERYFLYFEDTEWSLRATKRGWLNAVAPYAQAWHKVSRSTGGIANPAVRFYFVRNRYRFLNAYRPARGRARWRLRYLRGVFWDYIGIRHDRKARAAVIAAFLSLLSRRWDTYETATSRRKVQVLDAIAMALIRVALPLKRLFRPKRSGPVTPPDAPP